MTTRRLFQEGIACFNREHFFEAHDAFEELWMDERGPDVRFYQGLVQISTGFYHLRMKNIRGAVSQLRKGVEKLQHYAPEHHGIHLDALLPEIQRCIETLNAVSLDDFSRTEYQLPKI